MHSADPDQLDRVFGGWLTEQTHPALGDSSYYGASNGMMPFLRLRKSGT